MSSEARSSGKAWVYFTVQERGLANFDWHADAVWLTGFDPQTGPTDCHDRYRGQGITWRFELPEAQAPKGRLVTNIGLDRVENPAKQFVDFGAP